MPSHAWLYAGWSEDGSYPWGAGGHEALIWASNPWLEPHDLYSLRFPEKELRLLETQVARAPNSLPIWAPDGEQFFYTRPDGELVVRRADGNDAVPVGHVNAMYPQALWQLAPAQE